MLHILIPSKDNPETLLKQISVFHQIFSKTPEIKIIVLDNSASINQAVSEICVENNWIYDLNNARLSVADNFNRGIDFIRNREGYSVFIGDDDFINKKALDICKFLHKHNVTVYRPIFKSLVYWKGFSSRRGLVTSEFEVRRNNALLQGFHRLTKKLLFKEINKADGPQFNLIPSFYHCIFDNKAVKEFTFGPFAPDSYSAGFLNNKNISYVVAISDAVLPGSAPKSASAYTAVKDGFDTFLTHAHTSIYLECECLEALKELPYLSDNIWYLSFCAGYNGYASASEFTVTDIQDLFQQRSSRLLNLYKKIYSISSALAIKKDKYDIDEFISFLKKG